MGFAFTVISDYSGVDLYSYRQRPKHHSPGGYEQTIKGSEKQDHYQTRKFFFF